MFPMDSGSMLGGLLGYKAWYEEYTPERIREVARDGGKRHMKKD
jgi:hypothetical protein